MESHTETCDKLFCHFLFFKIVHFLYLLKKLASGSWFADLERQLLSSFLNLSFDKEQNNLQGHFIVTIIL